MWDTIYWVGFGIWLPIFLFSVVWLWAKYIFPLIKRNDNDRLVITAVVVILPILLFLAGLLAAAWYISLPIVLTIFAILILVDAADV